MKKRYPIDLTSVRLRKRKNGYVIYFRLPQGSTSGHSEAFKAKVALEAFIRPRTVNMMPLGKKVEIKTMETPPHTPPPSTGGRSP
jgi:hypothetical protein